MICSLLALLGMEIDTDTMDHDNPFLIGRIC
jgi:hypothetical protein